MIQPNINMQNQYDNNQIFQQNQDMLNNSFVNGGPNHDNSRIDYNQMNTASNQPFSNNMPPMQQHTIQDEDISSLKKEEYGRTLLAQIEEKRRILK